MPDVGVAAPRLRDTGDVSPIGTRDTKEGVFSAVHPGGYRKQSMRGGCASPGFFMLPYAITMRARLEIKAGCL